MIGLPSIVKEMKIKLFIILSIFMYSCTKDVCINNSTFSCYEPEIVLVDMNTSHNLSEQDTTFLEINVWAEDRDGLEDIAEVIYYIKRNFQNGFPHQDLTCQYEEDSDDEMVTFPEFILSRTSCYGGYDLILEKVCEELTDVQCQNSTECFVVNPDQALFYTFQSFKPSGYPDCGGYGPVEFQFQITDNGGFQDFSEEILVEIIP